MMQTEQLIAEVVAGHGRVPAETAATLAHVVSAIMFISMAATVNAERSIDEIVDEIAGQVAAILPG